MAKHHRHLYKLNSEGEVLRTYPVKITPLWYSLNYHGFLLKLSGKAKGFPLSKIRPMLPTLWEHSNYYIAGVNRESKSKVLVTIGF